MKKLKSLSLLVPLFFLSTATGTFLHAQDASLVVVLKQQSFQQFGPAAPSLQDNLSAIGLQAFVELNGPGTVQGATVDLSSGGTQTLALDDDQFSFAQGFESLSGLDTAHPDGDYTFNIDTLNDGEQAVTLTLAGSAWPSAPRAANYTAFQNFNSSQDFTLTWDPMVGGTANDFINVFLYSPSTGQEFETAGPGEPGSLNGTATSVVIPAGTFDAGVSLEAEILFARIVDIDFTYTGALAGYVKITEFEGRTQGGTDLIEPQLVQSIPMNQEANVERNVVASFTFNEPMQSGSAIAWEGNGGVDFTYTWSQDQRTLFCEPNAELPSETTLSWTLNPSTQPVGFQDLAGNALPEMQGSFTTSASSTGTGSDVKILFLGKERFHRQEGPAPTDTIRYLGLIDAAFKARNTVTRGVVTLPNAREAVLDVEFDRTGFEDGAEFAQQSDLDLFFPNGDYEVVLETVNDGNQTATLSVNGDQYPNVPTIQNFAATTQSIDPDAPLQVSWSAFSGGTASDFIAFEIDSEYGHSVYESADYGEVGALDGTATGVFLPAGTLAPGRTYTAFLIFLKVTEADTTSYPGARLVAGYASEIEFEMSTIGTVQPPSLSVLPITDSTFHLQLNGDKGVPYRLEMTTDFSFWQWIDVLDPDLETGTDTFSRPISGTSEFFRAREGF